MEHRKISETTSLNTMLQDFPASEIWRLQTDGWQHNLGPSNFRQQFYQGMDNGFKYIRDHWQDPLSAKLIEGIYLSAYRYEDDFASDPEYQKGIRNGVSAGFEIFMSQILENDSAIDEDGLDDFLKDWLEANQFKTANSTPIWRIKITEAEDLQSGKPGFYLTLKDLPVSGLDTKSFNTISELKDYLKNKLIEAGKAKTDSQSKGVRVEISSSAKISRNDLVNFMDHSIKKYQEEINHINQTTKDDTQKIAAMVKLIRKLHKAHAFPDGNGRTFVFLLMDLILMQNALHMRFTDTPTHFAGYSTPKLVKETILGIQKFQEYKITKAAAFLSGLNSTSVITNYPNIIKELGSKLSPNPMIAMAQLNELFLRIGNHNLKVPNDYWGLMNYSGISKFTAFVSSAPLAHQKVLSGIKQIYVEKFYELMAQIKKGDTSSMTLKGIEDWLTRHTIINDTKYVYQKDSARTDMSREIADAIEEEKKSYKPS